MSTTRRETESGRNPPHLFVRRRRLGINVVRNSIKAEKELVLKEGLVLLLGTVLRQRRISTIRGVELRERERRREREREREC